MDVESCALRQKQNKKVVCNRDLKLGATLLFQQRSSFSVSMHKAIIRTLASLHTNHPSFCTHTYYVIPTPKPHTHYYRGAYQFAGYYEFSSEVVAGVHYLCVLLCHCVSLHWTGCVSCEKPGSRRNQKGENEGGSLAFKE